MSERREESKREREYDEKVVEAGKSAAQAAIQFLDRHRGVLSSEQIRIIVRREKEIAEERYLESRGASRVNENFSRNPGMTLFVTTEGKNRAIVLCRDHDYPVSADQISSAPNGIWVLKFPKGIYIMSRGGAQFYQEGNMRNLDRSKKPFVLDYDDVLRVEGDSGELWQNRDYDWDGRPKK